MSPISDAVRRTTPTENGFPVASQVAWTLSEFARHDKEAVREIVAVLRPEQLAGWAPLPDPLPAVPAVRSAVWGRLQGLTAADRRLLLVAALSVLDHADVLFSAAAVDVGRVLGGPAAMLLVVGAGRFRFADPRVRATVVDDAHPTQHAAVHASLARAFRARGFPRAALWHGALSNPPESARHAKALLALSAQRLAHGDTEGAQEVADLVAQRFGGAVRMRALSLGGRAALWSGHLLSARERLEAAAAIEHPEVDEAASALGAVRALLAGPEEAGDLPSRAFFLLRPLVSVTPGVADRVAWEGILNVFRTWRNSPSEAGATQEQLYLSTAPAPARWPWTLAPGAVAPFTEAHVRLIQAVSQLHAGDRVGAGTTLRNAASRLPLAQAAGGVVTSLLHLAAQEDAQISPALLAAFAAIGPERVLVHDGRGVPRRGRPVVAAEHDGHRRTATEKDISPLSRREREILALVTDGLTNRVIGERLQISERTVEVHLGRIFRKMGVRSRAELLVRVFRSLIDTSAPGHERENVGDGRQERRAGPG